MGETLRIPNIAILASGEGTTADAYARSIFSGEVDANIGLVVAGKADAGIIQKAEDWNDIYNFDTEVVVINHHTHPKGKVDKGQTDEESAAITNLLRYRGIDLVVALGYMKIVRGLLVEEFGYIPGVHKSPYEARMLNIHPGPLPETAGFFKDGASQKVLDLGLQQTKQVMHVMSPELDGGPVVAEHVIEVSPMDDAGTLYSKVRESEKANIGRDIDNFYRERLNYLSDLTTTG